MLLRVSNLNKSIGLKDLFINLSFSIDAGEKVALIGRNGLGKSSLFKILNQEDQEFTGQIERKKDTSIVMTRQEHFFDQKVTAVEYVLSEVPGFNSLYEKVRDYEYNGEVNVSLEEYCDAINEFAEKDFYSIEGRVKQSLLDFGLTEEKVEGAFSNLSGGEKRFVELVRVMFSEADLALIDEPTNHMDYVGKQKFIEWLNQINKTLIVITHDRDVLQNVDKILELKDKQVTTFTGNYGEYLKQNSLRTTTGIRNYEQDSKRIEELKKGIRELTASGSISHSIKVMVDRFKRELEGLESSLERPSFWIDQKSLADVSDTVIESYHKYKEKNIHITQDNPQLHKKFLLSLKKVVLGYDEPLFQPINFDIQFGDRVFLKGKNGAGKSTLVRTIISKVRDESINAILFSGEIKVYPGLRLGIYEQEIDCKYLGMTLGEAVFHVYHDIRIPINEHKLNQILRRYLFDPVADARLTINQLSGGQKARFQLIKMFVNNPTLLILDEPTNHLDLPSIEELENALGNYNGGIIYITHDTYLERALSGNCIAVQK